ncbi:hypothetical protein GCM10023323_21800 [Streptomyces thinghirensis]|uniref:Uncharacterized protein n=1 Tax=Streptomyces thinghirensis TaxID=551547 RepID=A0ABP9SZB6_9ACTN
MSSQSTLSSTLCGPKTLTTRIPVRALTDPVEEGLLLSTDRHVRIGTGGHTRQAAFVTEVWDVELRQAEAGAWEESADAEWYCTSGEVMLWSYGGPSGPVIELGRPDT